MKLDFWSFFIGFFTAVIACAMSLIPVVDEHERIRKEIERKDEQLFKMSFDILNLNAKLAQEPVTNNASQTAQ